MTTACQPIDRDNIDSLLDLVWRMGPVLMRSGSLVSLTNQKEERKVISQALREEIIRRYKAASALGPANLTAIANACGVSYGSVVNITRPYRPKSTNPPRGNSERAAARAAEIIRRWRAGESQNEIAASLGVNSSVVGYYIRKRKNRT